MCRRPAARVLVFLVLIGLGPLNGAMAQAPSQGSTLGIATIDARLKLLIPINAINGTYTGTLTISAI